MWGWRALTGKWQRAGGRPTRRDNDEGADDTRVVHNWQNGIIIYLKLMSN